MKSPLAFHLWFTCTVFHLPISKQFFNFASKTSKLGTQTGADAKPWEIADSYHVLEYSQGSRQAYGKTFDPLSQWVNPRSKSKGSTSTSTGISKTPSKKVETKAIEVNSLPPKEPDNLRDYYKRYLDHFANSNPIVLDGLSQSKEAQNFVLAQFAHSNLVPDMIHDVFRYLLKFDKKPINRDEYLLWFDVLAKAVLGKNNRVTALQAQAALQQGLITLLERFRLDPDLLPSSAKLPSAGGPTPRVDPARARSPLAGPAGGRSPFSNKARLRDPVIEAAAALLLVIRNQWETFTDQVADMIKAIPFAQEINRPALGLGSHLGDKAQFKRLADFDPKLAALFQAAESHSLEAAEQESLVEALATMAKPSTPNSLQTKTAAVALLHHLASAEETQSQGEGLRRLAIGWLEHMRDGPSGALVLPHDHTLINKIRPPNQGQS